MDMLEGVGRRSGTDKILDLGVHSLNGYERNGLFRNNGDGTFTDVGWLHGADREEDGRGIAIFDFDRDGRLDIVIVKNRSGDVLWFPNNGTPKDGKLWKRHVITRAKPRKHGLVRGREETSGAVLVFKYEARNPKS